MIWQQTYDPFGSRWLSTLVAALPVVILLGLVAGGTFALMQFLVSNFHGSWLVDTAAGLVSIASLVGLLRFWQPRDGWTPPEEESQVAAMPTGRTLGGHAGGPGPASSQEAQPAARAIGNP